MDQETADWLIAMEKHYDGTETIHFPNEKERTLIKLKSGDKRQEFDLSIYRGRVELYKCTYQTLYSPEPLVRIDLSNVRHTNPDGILIVGPHIHVYREGYGTKWATALPSDFNRPDDFIVTLDNFFDFCNVITKPIIIQGWDIYNA